MKQILYSLLLSILFSSCIGDFSEWSKIGKIEIDPLLGFPLVDSRVRFQDFDNEIQEFTIAPRADGTITLYFEKEIIRAKAIDYFDFPTQTSPNYSYNGFDTGGSGTFGDITVGSNEVFGMNTTHAERIETLRLNTGTLLIHATSDLPANVSFTVQSAAITMANSTPLNFTQTLNTGLNEFTVDLKNSIFDLTNGGLNYNQLPLSISVTASSSGFPLTSLNSVSFSLEIVNTAFNLIYGEADYRSFEAGNGTENVDVMKNTSLADFSIEEPKVGVRVTSSFGFECQVQLNTFTLTGQDDVSTDLAGSIMGQNPFKITGPSFVNIGKDIVNEYYLEPANSNIKTLISSIPKSFVYDAEAVYLGGNNKIFIQDSSKIVVTAIAELPLYGSVSGLNFEKEFDFSSGIFESVKEGALEITTGNGYPLDIATVLEFYDVNGAFVTSLLTADPLIVKSPPVDAEGRTTSIEEKIVLIELTPELIDQLSQATKIKVLVTMNTKDNNSAPVRFTNDNYLDIHIGIKAKMNL